MSSYMTQRKHVVGRCPVLGCKHVRITFEDPIKTSATERAIDVLRRHVRRDHPEFIAAVTRAYIRVHCVR